MNQTSTRSRAAARDRAETVIDVIDLTDSTVSQRASQQRSAVSRSSQPRGPQQRSAQRPVRAPRPTHGSTRQRLSTELITPAERVTRSHHGIDVERSLLFAHGLDERGNRLVLASDSMTDEERRPHHIVAERQGSAHRPAQFAEIYRIADCFDDGNPNVTSIRPLTHDVRVATSSRETLTSAGAPRFTPREAPNHLRAVPQERVVRPAARPAGSAPARREPLAPTARVTAPSSTSPRPHRPAEATASAGALALARQVVPNEDRRQTSAPTRTPLRAVAPAPKRFTSYGVIGFWVAFVMVFLFAAVVMHATIARRQVSLDQINVRLEQSEYTNAQLRVEVASLQSPTRIADAAARLGLSTPTGIRFVQAVPASVAAQASSQPAAAQTSGALSPTNAGATAAPSPTGR